MTKTVELRGYRPSLVEQAVEGLKQAVSRGEELLVPLPGALRMRGPGGTYWAYGPRSGGWYQHVDGVWSRNPDPPERLEGLAELALRQVHVEESSLVGYSEPGGDANPIEVVELILQRLQQAFYEARLPHWQLENVLEGLVLVTKEDQVWAPGFLDGRWYRWQGTQWSPQPEPPVIARRRNHQPAPYCGQCGAKLRPGNRFCVSCGAPTGHHEGPTGPPPDTLERIITGPGWLPQRLADDWEPPASFPEILHCLQCGVLHLAAERRCSVCAAAVPVREGSVRICRNCGASLSADHGFCTRCGTQVGTA